MNRHVLAALVIMAATPAMAGTRSVDLGATFGGIGLGVGGYLDVQVAEDSHVVYGEGNSLDLIGLTALFHDDRYQSRYVEYRHVSPEPGNRFEWALGVARVDREYNQLFSDDGDFTARAKAASLSLGLRTTEIHSVWVWRVGVSALVPFDQTSPRVFENDVLARAYFSIALRFGR